MNAQYAAHPSRFHSFLSLVAGMSAPVDIDTSRHCKDTCLDICDRMYRGNANAAGSTLASEARDRKFSGCTNHDTEMQSHDQSAARVA